MPRPKNALSIEDVGNPYNPLSAADVWEWHKQNAADAWKAAQDPQTWRDAAQQYGQALLMGSIAPGGNSLGIRAFHGSPHSFDRFDLSKIGTGEGAQAYGHGMYFAEHEPVAQGYRDALTRGRGRGVTYDGQLLEPPSLPTGKPVHVQMTPQERALELLRVADGDRAAALRAAKGDLKWLSSLDPPGQQMMGYDPAAHAPWFQATIDAVKDLDRGKIGTAPRNPGSMYEVGINSDPEHFLHWDKPLSEQSQHVQDALQTHADLGGRQNWDDRATGQQIYKQITQDPTAREAASQLQFLGIPGIKYLDQGSRASGEGTHNYVVFNPENVEILRKYGLAGLMGGGAAAAASDGSP
jgi:hypothetical protein